MAELQRQAIKISATTPALGQKLATSTSTSASTSPNSAHINSPHTNLPCVVKLVLRPTRLADGSAGVAAGVEGGEVDQAGGVEGRGVQGGGREASGVEGGAGSSSAPITPADLWHRLGRRLPSDFSLEQTANDSMQTLYDSMQTTRSTQSALLIQRMGRGERSPLATYNVLDLQ